MSVSTGWQTGGSEMERSEQKKSLAQSSLLLSCLMGLIGLFIAGSGLLDLYTSFDLTRDGVILTGVAKEQRRGKFSPWGSKTETVVAYSWQNSEYIVNTSARHRLGQVQLILKSSKPADARVYSSLEMWIEPISKVLLGLILIAAPILWIQRRFRNLSVSTKP